MSDAKHTPGPWFTDEFGVITAQGRGILESIGETCWARWAQSQAQSVSGDNPDFETAEYCGRMVERAAANARLIAAAPDLLGLAKWALRRMQNEGTWLDGTDYPAACMVERHEQMTKALAIIAKAEGGTE